MLLPCIREHNSSILSEGNVRWVYVLCKKSGVHLAYAVAPNEYFPHYVGCYKNRKVRNDRVQYWCDAPAV